jgi:hypothetical protein
VFKQLRGLNHDAFKKHLKYKDNQMVLNEIIENEMDRVFRNKEDKLCVL